MAFDRNFLIRIGASADGNTRWKYSHPTDLLATILADGNYFNNSSDIVKQGDAVVLDCIDGKAETNIINTLPSGAISFDQTPFAQGSTGGGGSINLTPTQGTSTVTITPSGGGLPAVLTAGTAANSGILSTAQALQLANLGTAASRNVGLVAGNLPELDGAGQLPASILTNAPGGGGAVTSVVGQTGVVTDAQIVTSFDTFFGNQIWQGSAANNVGPIHAVSVTYSPTTHVGRYHQMDVSTNAVELALPNVATVPDGTEFFLDCNSALNQASLRVLVAGQMRSENGYATHDRQADEIFLGYSQADQAGAFVRVYVIGGQWRVEGHLRDTATDVLTFGSANWIKPNFLDVSVGDFSDGTRSGNFAFTDDDIESGRFIHSTENAGSPGANTADLPVLRRGLIVGWRDAASTLTIVLQGAATSPSTLVIQPNSQFAITNPPGTNISLISQQPVT